MVFSYIQYKSLDRETPNTQISSVSHFLLYAISYIYIHSIIKFFPSQILVSTYFVVLVYSKLFPCLKNLIIYLQNTFDLYQLLLVFFLFLHFHPDCG